MRVLFCDHFKVIQIHFVLLASMISSYIVPDISFHKLSDNHYSYTFNVGLVFVQYVQS